VLIYHLLDPAEFMPGKSGAVVQADWIQPELGSEVIALDMHMPRILSIGRIEE